MAFWGESEWKRELYWLAMNGVNLVLDITAQEAVSYTHLIINRQAFWQAYASFL